MYCRGCQELYPQSSPANLSCTSAEAYGLHIVIAIFPGNPDTCATVCTADHGTAD